jgi:photosystem II stability/assembly factor-like uncharacterized protein
MKKIVFLIALLIANGAVAQWVPLYTGRTNDFHSIFFTDADTGYAAGDNLIIKTIDGGLTWTDQYIGQNSLLNSMSFYDGLTGYVVGTSLTTAGQYPIILQTSDGGESWLYMDSPAGICHHAVQFLNYSTGYILSEIKTSGSTALIKTTSGGEIWQVLYPDFNYYYSLYFTDENTGFLAGKQGSILKTSDGGNFWLSVHFDPSLCFTSVFFPSPDTGYVAGGGIIKKTVDGGLTWFSVFNNTSVSVFSLWFTDRNTGYAAGPGIFTGEGLILKTSDGGVTWNTQYTNSGTSLYTVQFPETDTGYAAGCGGFIIKTTDGGGSGTGLPADQKKPDRLSVAPNPARDLAFIEVPSEGLLLVTDLTGKCIIKKPVKKGSNTLETSWLPAGIYCVQLIRDGRIHGSARLARSE